jgi:GrpB-like predicted nucleotidyltransferase (UPF0157 family)
VLGLKHGLNRLVDHDPEWATAFEEERTRIRSAVGDVARGIEHYGSTAVAGLRAKPIIDILLGVAPLEDWIKCKAPLESLGYDYAENAGVPGHFIFGRGRNRGERTHLLHVVEFDGESWRSNLAFRDALRADESLRAGYQRTKEQAVAVAPEGRAKYNELKHTFIERFNAQTSADAGHEEIDAILRRHR